MVEIHMARQAVFRMGAGGNLIGKQGELDFPGQIYLLLQGLVALFQNTGCFRGLDLRLHQLGDVAGNAHDALQVPVAAIPRKLADLAPGIILVKPCLMMEAGADGASGSHDVQLLLAGNIGHRLIEKVIVRPSSQVSRRGHAQLIGRGGIRQDEARFPVLEINAVRNVLNQGVEQVPVFRGAQFRRLPPGDVDPYPYQHDGAALLVPASVDADPAPALGIQLLHAYFNAHGHVGMAVQVTAHLLGKKGLVLLVDGKLRLGENIGGLLLAAGPHHGQAAVRVMDDARFDIPDIKPFFRRRQGHLDLVPGKNSLGGMSVA